MNECINILYAQEIKGVKSCGKILFIGKFVCGLVKYALVVMNYIHNTYNLSLK